jgi:hypothetical protein
VEGDLKTIMAGLACGEPNTISWDILRNHVSAFVSCPDWVSARGMRMLGVPVKGDPVVISGESGAVGMGLLAALMETDEYRDLRECHRPGSLQPGADVLHRGQHRPHEVPQGAVGRRVPHRLIFFFLSFPFQSTAGLPISAAPLCFSQIRPPGAGGTVRRTASV